MVWPPCASGCRGGVLGFHLSSHVEQLGKAAPAQVGGDTVACHGMDVADAVGSDVPAALAFESGAVLACPSCWSHALLVPSCQPVRMDRAQRRIVPMWVVVVSQWRCVGCVRLLMA
jgi:hypothetical protein